MILYTSSTGIWQSVWLEGVPAMSIARLEATPDIDLNAVTLTAVGLNVPPSTIVAAFIKDPQTNVVVGSGFGMIDNPFDVVFSIPAPRLWSPEDPHLYDLDVRLFNLTERQLFAPYEVFYTPQADVSSTPAGIASNSTVVDAVVGYVGMRKVSKCRDNLGILRFCLNNEPYLFLGECAYVFFALMHDLS